MQVIADIGVVVGDQPTLHAALQRQERRLGAAGVGVASKACRHLKAGKDVEHHEGLLASRVAEVAFFRRMAWQVWRADVDDLRMLFAGDRIGVADRCRAHIHWTVIDKSGNKLKDDRAATASATFFDRLVGAGSASKVERRDLDGRATLPPVPIGSSIARAQGVGRRDVQIDANVESNWR